MKLLLITGTVALLMGSCRPEDVSHHHVAAPGEDPISGSHGIHGDVSGSLDNSGIYRDLPLDPYTKFPNTGHGSLANHGVHGSDIPFKNVFDGAAVNPFEEKTKSFGSSLDVNSGLSGGFGSSSVGSYGNPVGKPGDSLGIIDGIKNTQGNSFSVPDKFSGSHGDFAGGFGVSHGGFDVKNKPGVSYVDSDKFASGFGGSHGDVDVKNKPGISYVGSDKFAGAFGGSHGGFDVIKNKPGISYADSSKFTGGQGHYAGGLDGSKNRLGVSFIEPGKFIGNHGSFASGFGRPINGLKFLGRGLGYVGGYGNAAGGFGRSFRGLKSLGSGVYSLPVVYYRGNPGYVGGLGRYIDVRNRYKPTNLAFGR
ncbi:ATP-dependent RNA helicase glh-2-like [Cherax quadricarinatus]|uniref:ATP-dependent RNA helicase glh-2-like n=1 Tax=Cherax quadricarinatus TaxID=27406 RepID=UPI00387E9AB8